MPIGLWPTQHFKKSREHRLNGAKQHRTLNKWGKKKVTATDTTNTTKKTIKLLTTSITFVMDIFNLHLFDLFPLKMWFYLFCARVYITLLLQITNTHPALLKPHRIVDHWRHRIASSENENCLPFDWPFWNLCFLKFLLACHKHLYLEID